MKQKQSPKRQWDNIWGFLGTAALLGIISYFLRDFLHVPLGYLGSYTWIGALLISFFFGLVYFSQFILPKSGLDGWYEGLQLAAIYFFDMLITLRYSILKQSPRPGQATSRTVSGHSVTPHWLYSFLVLRAGVTQNHEVLALTRGSSFSRASGPGFVKLYSGEMITWVVDLQPQLRTQLVKTNTRDGIPVETTITVIFRVRQLQENEEEIAYPYDPEAIFHIAYAHSIEGRDELLSWTEQVSPRATAILVEELTQYRLDDLYQDDASVVPLEMIQQKVKRRLERETERLGIEILGLGIGYLQLPEKVVEQRIKTWQTEWERQIKVQNAVGNAEAERRRKNARARAQIEIIHNITQNIDAMRQAGNNNLTQIIMLRMIDALEEATTDPVVQMILPQGLIVQLVEEASSQMKGWLLEAGEQDRV